MFLLQVFVGTGGVGVLSLLFLKELIAVSSVTKIFVGLTLLLHVDVKYPATWKSVRHGKCRYDLDLGINHQSLILDVYVCVIKVQTLLQCDCP